MKHPGVYLSVFWLATMVGSVWLVQDLKNNSGSPFGYVCPPCGCDAHDQALVFQAPGSCEFCGMPLITLKRRHSQVWELIFMSPEVTFYHHKFFYPVNFLALFIGFLSLFRFKRELPTVLFLVFFLSLVLYSFKNQLYGTSYSMHATRRWAFFPISCLLAAGPALWLYFLKSSKNAPVFTWRDWLHFLPAILVSLVNTVLFLGFETWREHAIFNNFDHYPGLAEQVAFLASGTFYSVAIVKLARNAPPPNGLFNNWQKRFPIFLLLVVGAMAMMVIINLYFFDLMSTWLDYHIVWLMIAAFTLWSTYTLVFKKEVIFQKDVKKENRLSDPKIEA